MESLPASSQLLVAAVPTLMACRHEVVSSLTLMHVEKAFFVGSGNASACLSLNSILLSTRWNSRF
jgi:hypothetical protein